MNWPSPQDLIDLGGWTFACIVLAIVIAAFIKGDLVPGWIHKRETERADKATDLLEHLTSAIEKQTATVEGLVNQMQSLAIALGVSRGGGR
jgi:hypothetical protein